jgi:hypothetical protein
MGAIFLPLGLSCLLDPCRCLFITPFVFFLLLETIGSGLLVCVCVCVCVCNLAGEIGVERRQVTRQSSSPISPTPLEKRKAAGGKNEKNIQRRKYLGIRYSIVVHRENRIARSCLVPM